MWVVNEGSTSKQVQDKERFQKTDGESAYRFKKKSLKLFMCIFLRESMLPSNSQGDYDIKRVKVTTLYTILKSGPVSFKVTQITLEISPDIHHTVTTPQL